MADISITAASVRHISGPTGTLVAGAALVAGEVVFKEAVTGLAKKADNDSATAGVRSVFGMALNGAAADQPVSLALNGAVVDVGAVLIAGVDYYLSGTPGGVAPRADVTTGDDPVRIGMALTTSRLQLDFADPNVTL